MRGIEHGTKGGTCDSSLAASLSSAISISLVSNSSSLCRHRRVCIASSTDFTTCFITQTTARTRCNCLLGTMRFADATRRRFGSCVLEAELFACLSRAYRRRLYSRIFCSLAARCCGLSRLTRSRRLRACASRFAGVNLAVRACASLRRRSAEGGLPVFLKDFPNCLGFHSDVIFF